MTTIDITSRMPMLASEVWEACAVPWKVVFSVSGTFISTEARRTSAMAWLSDTPGRKSNDRLTEGSWPRWVTVSGPTLELKEAMALSGTRVPVVERMYSMDSADGSRWYFGSSSRITQY